MTSTGSSPGSRLARGLDARQLRRLAVVVAILVFVGALVWVALGRQQRTPLDDALGVVPASTARVGFTDWSLIRASLGDPAVSTPQQVGAMVQRAYDHDLTGTSSISNSGPALQRHYGFSPGNAEWEAYAQSQQGATMVLKMPDSTDMTAITDRLAAIGYQRPGEADGVWRGGVDLVAALDPTITPELQYVVVLADRHLVVTSDSETYAATAGQVAEGKAPALWGQSGVPGLAQRASNVASAELWAGDFACQDLSMSKAAPEDAKYAGELVRQAGGVTRLGGLLIASDPHRVISLVFGFADSATAERNLRPRATLAVGTDVGGAGSFSDNYRMISAKQEGDQVVLTLQTKPSADYGISDIDTGPTIFAAC